jgi:hypothetical protein
MVIVLSFMSFGGSLAMQKGNSSGSVAGAACIQSGKTLNLAKKEILQ